MAARALITLLALLFAGFPAAGYALALQPMSDGEMEQVQGAGIAVALENFRFMMAPTSYMEQVGVAPSGTALCTGVGSVGSNTNCWRRGDLRWYGINLSGAGPGGSHWNEASCDASSLNCPRGGAIGGPGGWFSPFDNPYVMRAWSPAGMAYSGALINANPNNPDKTIYEYLAPTSQPDYTLSFWGEIEAGATRDPAQQPLSSGQGVSNGGGLLKSQTLIRGNAAGSAFRLFRFTDNPIYGQTFAMLYHSHLRGDFRFSVAQHASQASDAIGVPVVFGNNEGLHFYNVDAYIPIGQLYYQALVLNAVGTAGNFSLTLTRVPNNPTVYDRFYGLNTGDTRGFETARLRLLGWNDGCGGNAACINYRQSHGYVRYGDWFPTPRNGTPSSGTRNAPNTNNDGILFRACDGCPQFAAFARRPMVIDKRGESASMQHTQNYNCAINFGGGCTVSSTPINYSSTRYSASLPPGGPISVGPGNFTRAYMTQTVNLGDARIEGLLINQFELISCQAGGC